MKIDIAFKGDFEKYFVAALTRYARDKGVEVQDAIDETAAEIAKRIAARTQPYGLGQQKIRDFEKSIAMQAYRGIWDSPSGMNSPRAAHLHSRIGRQASVPKKIKRFNNRTIDPVHVHSYVDRLMTKAGKEKASWLDAGRKAWPKLVISAFYRAKLRKGTAQKYHTGMKRKVVIGSNLSYSTLSEDALYRSILNGYRTMYGKMKRRFNKVKTIK